MSSRSKAANELARQLFRLSLQDGAIAPERVAGVLEYLQKHPPAQPMAVLKAYQRLVQAEMARHVAVIEHAGAIAPAVVQSIAAGLGRQYRRTVTAVTQPNPALIAGLRVRIGDDIYESSVAGQLAELAATV